ncbi:MAG: gamma-glutamylcyclotransferase family protein [Gemmatimonadaceae bacterium]
MPLLFSYGTLRQASVQLELFGRQLSGGPDDLLGYERSMITVADAAFAQTSGSAQHAMLRPSPDPDARVPGMALEVTDQELAIADRYEPVEYRRVVANLASGRQAWVYVAAKPRTSDS